MTQEQFPWGELCEFFETSLAVVEELQITLEAFFTTKGI